MLVGWKGVSDDPKLASFRYRVRAPARALAARGHRVEVFDPARAELYDQVVFSKAYAAADRALAASVRRRGGRVVFDLCDNHLYNPLDHPKYRDARERLGEMIALADQVVCSTPALARVIAAAFGPPALVCIPDAVEVHATAPEPQTGPLRLLWYGSHGSPNAPSGMTDLLLIRDDLEAFARERDMLLTVCSNNREKFDRHIAPLGLPTRYAEWTLDGFGAELAASDLVVIPTSLNPFTACKTHNRLTTALYAGTPVVATGIESYRDFKRYCILDDWADGLRRVAADASAARALAASARPVLDRDWTIEAIAPRWEAALALPSSGRAARPRPAPADARLVGRLDAIAETAVTGWVYAPAHPEFTPNVVLEVDGRVVCRAAAAEPRADLESAGLRGDCGFRLPLPAGLRPGAAVGVRLETSEWAFADLPLLPADLANTEASRPAPVLLTPPRARAEVAARTVEAVRRQRRRLQQLSRPDARPERARRDAALRVLRDVAGPEPANETAMDSSVELRQLDRAGPVTA